MSLLLAAYTPAGAATPLADRTHIEEYDPTAHAGRLSCPSCSGPLVARRGAIRVHHFAHRAGASCDPWRQGMTAWHRSWQALWPRERTEVRVERGGKVHVADVLTETGNVIEFQHYARGALGARGLLRPAYDVGL